MKFIATNLIVLFLTFSAAFAKQNIAGEFDYYVLALSWLPAFCQKHQTKPECRAQSVNDLSAVSFSLHGLWPNKLKDRKHRYGYCGVEEEVKRLDKKGRWCSLGDVYTERELSVKMPGTMSCLQMHEWVKHGSCTKLTVDKYYERSLDLLDDFNSTLFVKKITSSISGEVNQAELYNKWQQEFPDYPNALSLVCKKISGKSYLTEVRLKLNKHIEGGLANSLQSRKKRKSNCAARIYVDEAGF